jgi:hypothetical protein
MAGELLQRLFEEGEALDQGQDCWEPLGSVVRKIVSRLDLARDGKPEKEQATNLDGALVD